MVYEFCAETASKLESCQINSKNRLLEVTPLHANSKKNKTINK